MNIHSQTILQRRVLPQPSPSIVAGGDCGGCVLGGILGIGISEVYDRLKEDRAAFSWPCMRSVLFTAINQGHADRAMTEVPFWSPYDGHAQFGNAAWLQSLGWFGYVRMGLDAGYYGICSINHEARGPLSEHNHWVMIVGAREVVVPIDAVPGASRIDQELLVSCSASCPEGRWIEAQEFLRTRGGFNVLLVRPTGTAR